MEILIAPPRFILWLVLGIDAVAVASVLLKKGKLVRRLISLGVVAAVSVVLLVSLYRPARLSVTDEAMVDSTYFRTLTVPWSDLTDAVIVRDFGASEYRPTLKVGGSSMPGLQTGWFKLANGATARVVIQSSADALILRSADTLWVLAPDRLSDLVAAIRARGVQVRE